MLVHCKELLKGSHICMQWSKLVLYFFAWPPIFSVGRAICGLSGPAGRLHPLGVLVPCGQQHPKKKAHIMPIVLPRRFLLMIAHLSFLTSLHVRLNSSVLHCLHCLKLHRLSLQKTKTVQYFYRFRF